MQGISAEIKAEYVRLFEAAERELKEALLIHDFIFYIEIAKFNKAQYSYKCKKVTFLLYFTKPVYYFIQQTLLN